ncbi:hypothetical protein ACVQFP_004082 [Yersinia enterocolitica]|uniref:Uncharacterized protein n=1 Tax=Yersinia enterocolitica subsp. palearctica serotype O:3 (strain DSM 13030 / CIP 106945 / Y11) TaxID=930944 RepID=A0A0H3NKL3_YERE1|nr:hypothetical protein [Yersinia enterocolitica]EKN3316190.1 hypothetical protein [Yersinia enterocolitica]EKN3319508.1 hypothetical protein [Yersinia enterocolitica]EKN3336141.1 hypothetical protein [Yersinia enterocolitica]EKN3371366.1 hypothetical protein [Yersinia enterocolitica]EKN3375315.1 hypothetical protein [Yersinia enterocolitica]
MKPVDKIELTLLRIQFIAEVSQVAQCSNSEFLVAMSLISDLTSQIVTSPNYDEIFYNADGKKSH